MKEATLQTSSIDRSNRWLRRSAVLSYTAQFSIDPARQSVVIDSLLNSPTIYKLVLEQSLVNFKGRDAANLIDENIPAHLRPQQDELLFVQGNIVGSGEDKSSDEAFSVRISTRFKEFRGNHEIVHTSEKATHGILPDDMPSNTLGRIVPVAIKHFRLAFDLFESTYTALSLGYVPTVTHGVLIESTEQKLQARFLDENYQDNTSFPGQRSTVITEVVHALEQACACDLRRDFFSKQQN